MNIATNLIGFKVRTHYGQEVPDEICALFLDHASMPKALIMKGVGDGYIQEVFVSALMPWREPAKDGDR